MARSKQDGTYTRTATDLEYKYNFGQTFAEVYNLISGVKESSEEAVKELDASLDPEEIFNRLTNYGQAQGIYRDDDGNVYVNATYIKSGYLSADRIQSSSITAAKIASSAITTDKIASSAITAVKIATGAITATKIAADAITSSKIAADAITGDHIAAGSTITSPEIIGGTIYATGKGAYTAMTSNGLQMFVSDVSKPKIELLNLDKIIQINLGAGSSTDDNIYGTFGLQKKETEAGCYYWSATETGTMCGFTFNDDGTITVHGTLVDSSGNSLT